MMSIMMMYNILWLQNSRVIIVTAGARQQEGETRLDLVQKNVGIFKSIVPELVRYSPDAVIVVVTNPCDIMAWVTWKLSGLPKHRIIASGTMLDTSRFRHLLAERFNVAAHSVHGLVFFTFAVHGRVFRTKDQFCVAVICLSLFSVTVLA